VTAKTRIPNGCGPAFLEWFREHTEAAWASYRPQGLEEMAIELKARPIVGCQWQRGTRWLGGLSEEQIDQVERQWGLCFPPDYRLFLSHLHGLDRPMLCPHWRETLEAVDGRLPHLYIEEWQGYLVLQEWPFFTNWQDDSAVQGAMDRIAETVLLDTAAEKQSQSPDIPWPAEWGKPPATLAARRARISELFAIAPRLIPLSGYRCLLAEPCRAGNPILTFVSPWVRTLDVVAPNLRSFLLEDFASLLGVDRAHVERAMTSARRARASFYHAIPFWGPILSYRALPG